MAFNITPIGIIHSSIKHRSDAPRQGYRGAPAVTIELAKDMEPALTGLSSGDDVIILTWLHQSDREVLQVHPRGDRRKPIRGVFATRSPDRPNPIGLHPVKILSIAGCMLEVEPVEAIDGTPVVDIKRALRR
jgi:tRNA-Thr(GGU) m(6)t(6)A37 methyltransferase TsaA